MNHLRPPAQDSASNPGQGARFTCCACLEDLPPAQPNHTTCPHCGHRIVLEIVQVPESMTSLYDPDDHGEWEGRA